MISLSSYIDHTLLKADATARQIDQLCQEAIEHRFKAVCVNPVWVKRARDCIGDAEPLVATVVGFPLGACGMRSKVLETEIAIQEGADEIDMVIHIGALKSGRPDLVQLEIEQVIAVADGALVKVIIETCYLTREEKILACEIAKQAGAAFVKTSTGFGSSGATEEDVALMRRVVGKGMGVKASGGIRDRAAAERMIASGADRLGTSASIMICQ